MDCTKCGSYIADGWRFCKGCGREVGPHRPPHQAETIPLGSGSPSPGTEPTLVMQNPPWNAAAPPAAETVQSPWPQADAAPPTNPNAWSPPSATPTPPRAKSSNVLLPILIVVGILVLGAGTVVALILTGVIGYKNSSVTAGTQPNAAPNGNVGGGGNANIAATPTPDLSNTNANAPPVTPTPPDDSAAVRAQVMATINAWADSLRRRNLDENMGYYADQLDIYYGSSSVSKGSVRSNRAQIFSRYYDSTDVQLSDVNIEVSPDGNHAEVTYDNTYDWRGGAKTLSGKSHNKMILDRRGSWVITSEIHLSQYYENRGG